MLTVSCLFLSVILAFAAAQPPAECMSGPRVNPEQCCPGVTPPYMANGAQCGLPDMSSGNPGGPPSGGPPSCDNIKCTFKDYLTSDGKLDQTQFLNAMNAYYTSSSLKALVQPAFQKCYAQDSGSDPCPLAKFGGCFGAEMFKNCPDNGNADCTTAKSLMEKCAPPN